MSDLMNNQLEVTLVRTVDEVNQFVKWLNQERTVLAIDTETTGTNWTTDKLRLVQFGDSNASYAIAWDEWPLLIKDSIENYDRTLALHNHKFDSHFLRSEGVELPTVKRHCTMTLAHLHNPGDQKGLKALAKKYMPGLHIAEHELQDKMKDNKWDWATVPLDLPEYWLYGGIDTIITARLFDYLYPKVNKELYDIEMTSQIALEYMEATGVKVDTEYLEKLGTTLDDYIKEVEHYALQEFGINIRSKKQLEQALLAQGWHPTMYTPTGQVSLAKDALANCDLPLAGAFTDMKYAEKMLTTFSNKLLNLQTDSIVHPSINPVGARTGRMSMSNPNLQQLPRTKMIRDAFIPRTDQLFVISDYDAVELRIFAHYANDSSLQDASSQGDPHTATAQLLWPGVEIGSQQRNIAKGVSYAILYGAGVETISKFADLDIQQAADILDNYQRTFPGINRFFQQIQKTPEDKDTGLIQVETQSGRKQTVPDKDIRWKLANYLIQGSSADVLKHAISRIWQSDIASYIRLPVHDELVFEVPKDDAEEVSKRVEELMYDGTYNPALTAEAGVYKRWGDKYGK